MALGFLLLYMHNALCGSRTTSQSIITALLLLQGKLNITTGSPPQFYSAPFDGIPPNPRA